MKPVKFVVAASLLGVALIQPWVAQPAAQASAWFRANYENLNEAGANMYNFANRYAQSATTWTTDHQATGGWNGSGGAHVVIKGCPQGGCNTSTHQFNIGWQTPGIGQPLGRPFQLGDSAFIRFRIKFDPNTSFPRDQWGAKFILWGTTGTSPNSRWIIHLFPAMNNGGCTLGFDYNYLGWTPPSTMWTTSSQFGLSSNFDRSPSDAMYAGFQSHVNIGWSCNPAVLVTRSNHASPVPKPQSNGAAPSGGWYHVQFQATSGANGTADFRTWANNNVQSAPSSERLNMPDGLGVQGWDQGIFVGGYWGTEQPTDIGFVIDDFEVGPSFDPNWYPGASGGPAPTPPGAPTGVRIVSN
jgi:hypothetical protein